MSNQGALEAEPVERKLNSSAELLLDSTAALLGQRSALDVSLSDIARLSKLNASLIKYYFGNKNGLLLALLERDAEKAMAALDNLVQMPISAEQKLKIHIGGIINAFYRSPFLNRLIHFMREYGEEKSRERIGEIYVEPMIAAYEAIIAQGVAEGTFRSTDPKLLYCSLVGACDHIFHAEHLVTAELRRSRIDEAVKNDYIDHVTQIFLRGILAPDKPF